jgi:hypothetical protein
MNHSPATPSGPPTPDAFGQLLAEAVRGAARLGHRQHVHLTWLAIRRYGVDSAIVLVSDGLRRTTRYAGVPQKYHATVSRAWVVLVDHHMTPDDDGDFDTFANRHPALLNKRLLAGHYRSSTLATVEAKTGWVEPDLEPFPWPTASAEQAGA